MAKVEMATELPVPAQRVWDLIGGFHTLADWHPAIEKSEIETEGTTTLRRLYLAGGGTLLERLEAVDDAERVLRYSIVESPLPVGDYLATLRVRDRGDGRSCTVEWSSEFEPVGAPEPDAVKVIEGIYQAGFENLKRIFGG